MTKDRVRPIAAFIDLAAQREQLGDSVETAIAAVLKHGQYVLGPEVSELERRLAEFCGARHCISCANGTDALLLVLMAEGIGPGDAVLVPDFTFVATAEVVVLAGATPVFVDVHPDSFNLDVESLEAAIGEAKRRGLKPRAVIPVDLYGQPADYDAINRVAEAHDLLVLADAAQSFGASLNGKKVGTLAAYTATSFYPSKPLGGYGDGGAIFTDDDAKAKLLVSMRCHGKAPDQAESEYVGLNSRLDTIQAAILLEKLRLFPSEIAARQNAADRYAEGLGDVVQVPKLIPGRGLGLGAIHHSRRAPRGVRQSLPRGWPADRDPLSQPDPRAPVLPRLPASARPSPHGSARPPRDQPADARLSRPRDARPHRRHGAGDRPLAQGRGRRGVAVRGTMADQIRVAVVGAGYFGRFHADHYSRNPRAKLVAVVDTSEERARAVATEFGAEPLLDYRDVIGRVDAVSVAVPTPLHYQIARALIDAGMHILVEKPITDSVESASTLTNLAEQRNRVLQVGHIERFSSSYNTLAKVIAEPLYFDSYRIAPWKNRGVEVDVILDLMIHDIDMIIGLVASPVVKVDAVGTPVLGQRIDVANARITFASGCVANVTASRVAYKTERKLRVFARNHYLSCDLGEGRIQGYRLRGDPMTEGLAAIAMETYEIPKQDSLGNEIEAFLDCIATGKKPLVDGRAGSEALRVASMINESIEEHLRVVQGRPGAAPAS